MRKNLLPHKAMARQSKIWIFIILTFIILGTIFFLSSNKKLSQIEKNSIPQEIKKVEQEKFASIQVLDKIYKSPIGEKDTVYDLMKSLQNNKENNFTFTYKEYPGMGIFINGINNVEGSPGKYWIYYVNGEEASVSVSKNIIKEGDVITWKQE